MHTDGQGRRGRPITTSGAPSNDKEKELFGQGVSTTEALSAGHFLQDGRLSPLPLSSLPWMNNNGIRSLSLSPAPSSQRSLVGPPGYAAAAGKNTGRGCGPAALRAYMASTWRGNQGPILVCVSQFFGALMSAVTRLLELDEETGPMHPMMILFWRMSATALFSGLWTYYSGRRRRRRALQLGRGGSSSKIDSWQDEIFGVRAVRGLLVFRSAVVISFLAPTLAGYLCHVFLHDRFTRWEQLASFLALAGVVLIVRPISLFAATTAAAGDPNAISGAVLVDGSVAEGVLFSGNGNGTSAAAGGGASPVASAATTTEPTPAERLIAIMAALIGVLGGALTIVTLREIGTRAPTLISVNYFSVGCVVVTTAALAFGPPHMRFALPATWRQASMLVLISVCGFATQFLMTSGIAMASSSSFSSDVDDGEEGGGEEGGEGRQKKKVKGKATDANRATAMIYTNMLFSAAFDRWLFGESMGWVTVSGCALIVGSALWVVVTKSSGDKEQHRDGDGETRGPQMRGYDIDAVEEGVVLLESMDGTGSVDSDGDDDDHTAGEDRVGRL
ncbi:hypothetical protein PG994_001708 [Apiospora phragmitis]|uniref:EamA domain-containing protein n=1 Tax=Apiospora phragmitis TaxID=2905665 RepID=A0ABR1WUA5_9PEZI